MNIEVRIELTEEQGEAFRQAILDQPSLRTEHSMGYLRDWPIRYRIQEWLRERMLIEVDRAFHQWDGSWKKDAI